MTTVCFPALCHVLEHIIGHRYHEQSPLSLYATSKESLQNLPSLMFSGLKLGEKMSQHLSLRLSINILWYMLIAYFIQSEKSGTQLKILSETNNQN